MNVDIGTERERAQRRPPPLTGAARVWMFSGLLATLAAALYLGFVRVLQPLDPPFRIPWALLALMFLVAEILTVYVEFRRNAFAFSLSEIALVIGLFTVTPETLILAQLAGAAIALTVHRRQSPLKVVFNLSHFALETTIAVLIFHLVGAGHPLEPMAWAGALLATFAMAIVADIAIGVAVSLSEGRMQLQSIFQGLAFSKVVSATNTSIGLIGVMILATKPIGAWLLAVPAAILFFAYRVYTSQREQHARMEFLYEATHLLNRSLKMEAALDTVLTQARKMFRAQIARIIMLPTAEGEPALCTTLGPGDELRALEPIHLDPREGVWARVASEGEAVLLPRPITNEPLRRYYASVGIHDAMVAPLRGKNGVVGTILVGNRLGDVSTFDRDDLKLFEALANHASTAVENARLVQRLEESLDHLREINRVKDDFVASVSLELRTALTAIQGSVKTLLQPEVTFDPETQTELLEAVDRQSERLRQLIEDLLIAARIESQKIVPVVAPVSLGGLVRQVVDGMHARSRDHRIVIDDTGDPGPILTDERRVYQIISNLFENAIKYAPPATTVTIQVRPAPGGVEVAVADEGPGVPTDLQEKIFERFYQADQTSTRQVGGTGLGLYICRRLAEVIGGRIGVERSGSRGSLFTLWVPATPPSDAMAPGMQPTDQTLDLLAVERG